MMARIGYMETWAFVRSVSKEGDPDASAAAVDGIVKSN